MEWRIRRRAAGGWSADRGATVDSKTRNVNGPGFYMPAFIIHEAHAFETEKQALRYVAARELAADLQDLARDMDPFGYDPDDARSLADDITGGNIEYIADGLATIAADNCNDFSDRARAAELLARLLRMFA